MVGWSKEANLSGTLERTFYSLAYSNQSGIWQAGPGPGTEVV